MTLAETLITTILSWGEFSGPWETREAFVRLVPLAWMCTTPSAMAGAVAVWLWTAPGHRRRSNAAVAVVVGTLALAIGWSVSGGRHFAFMPLRIVFVVGCAAVSSVAAWVFGPWIGRSAQRWPARASAAAVVGVIGIEIANLMILPRLYPGFHQALTHLVASCACLVALGLRPARISHREQRWRLIASAIVLALLAVRSVSTVRRLALADNLRRIALERSPMAGMAVLFAARIAPPPPLLAESDDAGDQPEEARSEGALPARLRSGDGVSVSLHTGDAASARAQAGTARMGDSTRALGEPGLLNWRGWSVLLLTVDAVRADHVSAYGYPRATTPEIDALARTGVLFEHAYCPTPHTSYSVTSLMTGKNLRPLLAQGLGEDSDTWAGLLRRYGYRTAAFYPPAVFFIDTERFVRFRDNKLDFEYARVEFADPLERADAVEKYLSRAPSGRPLFLWIHLFEPHEPYVSHAEHPFGDRDLDRYDGEIAFADTGIGAVARAVRAVRPNTVVLVASDHGEEFGDHGSHYHGTTVYEEQVRVPLIVQAPGLVPEGKRVAPPVQTIDLLPTILDALDIPRPARVRGTSLRQWLVGAVASASAPAASAGSTDHHERELHDGVGARETAARPHPPAFSETDEQLLLAKDTHRLICLRRVSACALYDLVSDPAEKHDRSRIDPERFQSMKAELRRLEASHGRFESRGLAAEGGAWPAAIRRAEAGDGDAAVDVAPLLEDADVRLRRKAAEVLLELARAEAVPALRLAAARDEDESIRDLSALAVARSEQDTAAWQKRDRDRVLELINAHDEHLRRFAALTAAEHGDGRGVPLLLAWWHSGVPFERARQIVEALGRARSKDAVSALVDALADVRLRPNAAAALAAIGHPSAKGPLLEQFARERYQTSRRALARSLVALGAKHELAGPLARWLGTPDPLAGGLGLATEAGILSDVGGPTGADLVRLASDAGTEPAGVGMRLHLPQRQGNGAGCRVLVRGRSTDGGTAEISVTSDDLARGSEEPGRPSAMGVRLELPSLQGAASDPRIQPSVPAAGSVDGTSPSEGSVEGTSPGEGSGLEIGQPEIAALWPDARCPTKRTELRVRVRRSANARVEALAILPLQDELPPPPPQPWTPDEREVNESEVRETSQNLAPPRSPSQAPH